MNNFIIGHHGCYSQKKQSRDYRASFWGVEACLIDSDSDIEELYQLSKQNNVNLGIHFPLRTGQWQHRDPQYLSNSIDTREESYAYMEREINNAVQFEPDYILLHYPKPVLLDERVDWHGWKWRFGHKSEYFFESECDMETFVARSDNFFKWFSEMGSRQKFNPVLELDAIPRYIYETTVLPELLEKYPNIKICADIGRLHLQHMIDPNFDSFSFLEMIAGHVSEVHLWNIQVKDELFHSHYPALSTLNPEEGWADVKKYIEIIKTATRDFKILFEHRSDLISDEELDQCYEWISSIYSG